MNCYICNSRHFGERKAEVRDAPEIKVLECNNCGLVSLDSFAHIHSNFYRDSGMHGEQLKPIEDWLKETRWDDQRRFEQLKHFLLNKRILDFGCGAGGFLSNAKSLAADAVGVELELRVQNFYENSDITILSSMEDAASSSSGGDFDAITAFHVFEHLPDPREVLKKLGTMLKSDGRIVIEVPSADDVLLTLYDCDAFQRFTYWSQHLYLFTASTLATLIKQAGLKVVSIQHYQRYPLSNHLHWLCKSKPGGHQSWSFLDNPALTYAYAEVLASIGKTDTLIAHVEKR
jgi:2-polyprenyl-3-methyl-5-hydroxy-6-metoxy-1,4-benzoquinol methylase